MFSIKDHRLDGKTGFFEILSGFLVHRLVFGGNLLPVEIRFSSGTTSDDNAMTSAKERTINSNYYWSRIQTIKLNYPITIKTPFNSFGGFTVLTCQLFKGLFTKEIFLEKLPRWLRRVVFSPKSDTAFFA